MIAELSALRTILGAPGAIQAGVTVPVVIGDATGHRPPFVVLWGVTGVGDGDESVSGPCGAWTAPAGVTCTGQDPEAALALMEAVRGVIAPDMTPTVLPGVTGRHVVVDLTDARAVQVDRTVTLTTTGTHPAYGVLLLDIHSAPTT